MPAKQMTRNRQRNPRGQGERLRDDIIEAASRLLADRAEAFLTAQLIWEQLHGLVSLRISRPKFPWPPLDQTVLTAVDRLLGAASQRPGERP